MEKSLEADRETADMLCTKKLPEVCGAGRESGEQAEMGNGDRKFPQVQKLWNLLGVRVPLNSSAPSALGSQALYVLLFQVVRESVACPHLLEARPRGGAVRACVGWWL